MKTYKSLNFVSALLLSVFISSTAVAAAETDDNKDVVNITPINVIGSSLSLSAADSFDIPAMETKISIKDDNLNLLSHDLRGLTANIPQLQVSGGPRSLAQSFTMRGFDKNGVDVMVDDIPVNFLSQHMNNLFVDPFMISSIDVIRGPFSSIYGSNAVGGVVSFRTIEPEDLLQGDKKYGATIGTGYSSVDQGITGMVSGYAKSDHSDFLIGISGNDSDRIKSGDNGKMTVPEDAKNINGLIKSKVDLSDNQFIKISYYFNENDSLVPANPEQNNNGDFMLTNINHKVNIMNHVVRLEHNYLSSDGSTPDLKTVVYYNYMKQSEDPKQDFPGGVFYKKGDDLGKTLNVFGGSHQEHVGVKVSDNVNTSVVYGVSYEGQKQDKNSDDPRGLVANATSNNIAGFVNNEWFLSQYINVAGGMRYDFFNIKNDGSTVVDPNTNQNIANSKNYNQFSPKASITFKPFKPFMTYVSYGRAFRTPNLNEIYASGFHYITQMGPYTISNNLIPNPNLKPSTADTFEGGYGFNFKQLPLDGEVKLKNAFYYTKAKDYITLAMSQATSQYVNVPRADMEGIDLDFSYENSIFRLASSYNYIRAVNPDTNTALMNISSNTANVNYEQKIMDTGVSIGYGLRAQSSFKTCKTEPGMGNYACSMGQVKNPGFATHNIYVNYKYSGYSFSAGVYNLTDKFYYDTFSGLPSSGRSYNFMITKSI
ncbi:TonB-dependent receptor domain-containing protein [Rickettsiales bacterium LUAb2]